MRECVREREAARRCRVRWARNLESRLRAEANTVTFPVMGTLAAVGGLEGMLAAAEG